ncbi:hypothetical protein B9Z55_015242 [Caenorhabditis nigoni]|uniref:Uncharacterized protein n=1 Tax=Caenorhabditis nigoni TaxID=1611254 RepID=A0A2G5U9A9_9PELO|nr:hypothetical protein B9Z55_015242 [Caenorhabditis nigoni]
MKHTLYTTLFLLYSTALIPTVIPCEVTFVIETGRNFNSSDIEKVLEKSVDSLSQCTRYCSSEREISLKEDSGQNEFMVQSMQNFMLIPNITMKMLKNAAKAQKTPSKLQKSYPSWPNFCRFSTWISIFALFT